MNPTVLAAVLGFAGIVMGNLLGPTLARLTARWQRRAQKQDDLLSAKVAADESDRARVSANMWAIVKDLRAEVADLRAALDKREAQVDRLIEDMGQLRAIERQLRDENSKLRDRVKALEGQLAGISLTPPAPQAQP